MNISIKFKVFLLFFLSFLVSNYAFCACNISITPINFGVYNPFSKNDNETSGKINVQCLAPVFLSVKLTSGNTSNFNLRYLAQSSGSDKIYYNVFLDSQKTQIWADGSSGSYYYINLGLLSLFTYSIPVYGRINKLQNVSAGTYSDSLAVNIYF